MNTEKSKTILLQGDVCIDVDIAITEPTATNLPPCDFWFTQGESLHSRELLGGAGYTRRFLEALLKAQDVTPNFHESSVEKSIRAFRSQNRKYKLIRSVRVLKKHNWKKEAKEKVWRIDDYLAPSPRQPSDALFLPPKKEEEKKREKKKTVDVLAIEDQQLQYFGIPDEGIGEERRIGPFRVLADKWNELKGNNLQEKNFHTIIKTTDLLGKGWQAFFEKIQLQPDELESTANITIFTPLSDLKKVVPGIHPGLSWDKTIGTILKAIKHPENNSKGSKNRSYVNFVIQLELEGILVIWDNKYTLIYDPDRQPGDLSEFWNKSVSGSGSIIFATLIADAAIKGLDNPENLIESAQLGLARARLFTAIGYLHPVQKDKVGKEVVEDGFVKESQEKCPECPLALLARLSQKQVIGGNTEQKQPKEGKPEWQTDKVVQELRRRKGLVTAADDIVNLATRLHPTSKIKVPNKSELERGDRPGKNLFKIIQGVMEQKIQDTKNAKKNRNKRKNKK